jgi:predicted kinase
MQERPRLIVVSGLPGVGKSTVADGLSEKLKLAVLSVDPIESGILKSGIKRSFKTGLAAYLVAETLAAEQLRLGHSVIVDAVSPVKEARDMWRSLSKQYRAKLVIIECVLDSVLHKKRIEVRVRKMRGIPEVTWEEVQDRRRQYLEWEEDRLVLDTARTREENLKSALEYIASLNSEETVN